MKGKPRQSPRARCLRSTRIGGGRCNACGQLTEMLHIPGAWAKSDRPALLGEV
jgi:hypothetical protein